MYSKDFLPIHADVHADHAFHAWPTLIGSERLKINQYLIIISNLNLCKTTIDFRIIFDYWH